MIRKYPVRALLAALCAFPAVSYALSPEEPLDMIFEQPAAPRATSIANTSGVVDVPEAELLRLSRPCTLLVTGVDDLRRNKDFVGNSTFMFVGTGATPIFMQSLRSGDAGKWTRSAIGSLQRYGFQVQDGAPAPELAVNQISAKVGLRLAHTWATPGFNLVSHVVLKVNYLTPSGPVEREYHGMGSRMNGYNGNSEYMTALNRGIDEALKGIAVEGGALCAGRPLPSQTAEL